MTNYLSSSLLEGGREDGWEEVRTTTLILVLAGARDGCFAITRDGFCALPPWIRRLHNIVGLPVGHRKKAGVKSPVDGTVRSKKRG